MRAALLHVLADLLGSVGVVVAALLVLGPGWPIADPVARPRASAVLVLLGSWRVLRESVAVLLEAAPEGLDVDEIGRAMAAAPGVREVHDLHVWTITSGFPALSAHVLVDHAEDCHARRRELAEMLENRVPHPPHHPPGGAQRRRGAPARGAPHRPDAARRRCAGPSDPVVTPLRS